MEEEEEEEQGGRQETQGFSGCSGPATATLQLLGKGARTSVPHPPTPRRPSAGPTGGAAAVPPPVRPQGPVGSGWRPGSFLPELFT